MPTLERGILIPLQLKWVPLDLHFTVNDSQPHQKYPYVLRNIAKLDANPPRSFSVTSSYY